MVCEKCQQREAIVHLTQIVGDGMSKANLCEPCARDGAVPIRDVLQAGWTSYSAEPVVVWKLSHLIQALGRQPHYQKDAYEFVCGALASALLAQRTKRRTRIKNLTSPEHVSAAQLLEAFRQNALKKFGKQARAKLGEWGIHRTEDVGEIVFDMVEAGFSDKSPEDKKTDFASGYNFGEAFPED